MRAKGQTEKSFELCVHFIPYVQMSHAKSYILSRYREVRKAAPLSIQPASPY
jgi:hypothetical protein